MMGGLSRAQKSTLVDEWETGKARQFFAGVRDTACYGP